MARPNTRATFKEYCLRSLGKPVIDINVDEDQIEPFLPYIYDKLNWLDREKLIKHFVSAEFNRYLSYYKHSKDINILSFEKDNKKRPKRKRRRFFSNQKTE